MVKESEVNAKKVRDYILSEFVTVLLPGVSVVCPILSLRFQRCGLWTPVWRTAVEQNCDIIHLEEVCQWTCAR